MKEKYVVLGEKSKNSEKKEIGKNELKEKMRKVVKGT